MILHYNKRIIPKHYLRNISNQFKDMREGGCAPFVPILDYTLAYSLILIFTFPGDGFIRICEGRTLALPWRLHLRYFPAT